ncbi:DUF1801 domain-containing protein [Winogradskyella luteola]|uniref:DUF1801 domain-containing protein n=1 Tax=Winogradskyella luteola TaxID=2828330 RepID=A0A9X1F9P8_9FLAO|nr:DUF1801 domain-containing protein [Winogradskyella luteola]MBV7268983.1 DUF1801 domain-containing protein [Winogradskyella luteola]
MNDLEAFKSTFVNASEAQRIGLKLRSIVLGFFPNAEESILGGAKVKLVLYSRGDAKNVLCGIQQAAKDTCMLYVHHIDSIVHQRLKFSGKGKHAKRIKFESADDVKEDEIRWLLKQVEENTPF